MVRAAISSQQSPCDRDPRVHDASVSGTTPGVDRLVRFLIAVGTQRLQLQRANGGRDVAHVAALHPEDLEEIRALGEEAYARNSRSFAEVLGLELVADATIARNCVEVRV